MIHSYSLSFGVHFSVARLILGRGPKLLLPFLCSLHFLTGLRKCFTSPPVFVIHLSLADMIQYSTARGDHLSTLKYNR